MSALVMNGTHKGSVTLTGYWDDSLHPRGYALVDRGGSLVPSILGMPMAFYL